MNRRGFLKIAGSTAVILAAGGAGFALTRTPTAAHQPWENAGKQYTDPMKNALSYAILAPNPHNRQPWIVDLKSETEAVLTCDLDRLLPTTDPFSRQIVIGLGCFLEQFSIAAQQDGYRAQITYFPDGQDVERLDTRPIAHIKLVKDASITKDPLFAQILDRHTNRNPYDMARPVSAASLTRIESAAGAKVTTGSTGSGGLLDELRNLTSDAIVTEMKTPDAGQESVDLMRIGKAEIEANPDGISLGGPLMDSLALVGAMTRESMADPTSSNFQLGIDMVKTGALASMGFVWINTANNDRIAQIEAGRAYMRVALQVSAEGLSMQPMSQALQEYDEMAPFFETIHTNLLQNPGERVQMLARLGYAENVGPSPRWPLETRLKQNQTG
ncbi:MAG: twin-arginine translocation pathway signal protein [Cohaesibacteraceae bacterium]|nr:twin-arginine translocation pathway signal protein [Cohaesibacteraceae bacterium]